MKNDNIYRFKWDGTAMVPLFGAGQFAAGEIYNFVQINDRQARSRETHNQFFAQIEEGWHNLPELYQERLPTPEHLRKWCLIAAGFYNTREQVWPTPEIARQVAAFIQPSDDFAVVRVEGNIVTVLTAKSQRELMMDKTEFQASKQAVFDVIARILGIPSFGDTTTYQPISVRRNRKATTEKQRKAAARSNARTKVAPAEPRPDERELAKIGRGKAS